MAALPYRELIAQAMKTVTPEALELASPSEKTIAFYLKMFRRLPVRNLSIRELLDRADEIGGNQFYNTLTTLNSWKTIKGVPLTEVERMVDACYWMNCEVNNGTFHQYFFNSAGGDWPFVMQVLEEGGDQDGEQQFRGLLSIFPSGCPAIAREERWRQLDAMKEADEQGMWDHFGRYTDSYYERVFPSGDSLNALVRARIGEFHPVWPDEDLVVQS